jgi:hypothetical protein
MRRKSCAALTVGAVSVVVTVVLLAAIALGVLRCPLIGKGLKRLRQMRPTKVGLLHGILGHPIRV